jgi:hypothetical protein
VTAGKAIAYAAPESDIADRVKGFISLAFFLSTNYMAE